MNATVWSVSCSVNYVAVNSIIDFGSTAMKMQQWIIFCIVVEIQNISHLRGYHKSLGPFGLKKWITSCMAIGCCCQQYKGTWVFMYSAQHFCSVLKKFDFLNRFNENPVGATLIHMDRWMVEQSWWS